MKSLRNVLIIYERVHCYAKRQLKRRDIIKAGEKSTNRNIESVHRADVVDTSKKRSNSRANDAEPFTRLFYYGTAQLRLASENV